MALKVHQEKEKVHANYPYITIQTLLCSSFPFRSSFLFCDVDVLCFMLFSERERVHYVMSSLILILLNGRGYTYKQIIIQVFLQHDDGGTTQNLNGNLLQLLQNFLLEKRVKCWGKLAPFTLIHFIAFTIHSLHSFPPSVTRCIANNKNAFASLLKIKN